MQCRNGSSVHRLAGERGKLDSAGRGRVLGVWAWMDGIEKKKAG